MSTLRSNLNRILKYSFPDPRLVIRYKQYNFGSVGLRGMSATEFSPKAHGDAKRLSTYIHLPVIMPFALFTTNIMLMPAA